MSDGTEKPVDSEGPVPGESTSPEEPRERARVSDFVRRAVVAGMEAAGKSKDDVLKAAAGEIRTWLDHLELDNELKKALAGMVLEVKAEIRFRPTEDGKLAPQGETDVHIRSTKG